MTTPATYHVPDDRYYDREHHLWVQKDPTTGQVVVGLDTLGLAALGDLAYISLQAADMPIKRGESMGMLEAAKMTGDLFAPVSGTLIARNEAALRDPHLVNSDPYGQGWLVAIEPADWENESASLVSGEELPIWVAAEIERYRSQGWIE
ncbi:MAG: glycine cleavage system protein H [Anaerolineae bacterium]|nr:glycine cleavage system protein H [Anaerolineae bacterium]